MKKVLKIILIVALSLVVLYFVVGAVFYGIYEHNRRSALELDGPMITVTNDAYVEYLEELYIHADKYLGRTIVIEGVYDFIEHEGTKIHFVGREFVAEDHLHAEESEEAHMVGFEFTSMDTLPEKGSYLQVSGTLEMVEEAGEEYLVLADSMICEVQKSAQ